MVDGDREKLGGMNARERETRERIGLLIERGLGNTGDKSVVDGKKKVGREEDLGNREKLWEVESGVLQGDASVVKRNIESLVDEEERREPCG